MLRISIIGCGQIADSHASQIKRVTGCELVGVCDREELMAQQLAQRFGVKSYFTDVAHLLESCRPDVVHITTPPQSHFEIAKLCLEQGANVYVEKPFTLRTRDAEELVALAEEKGLKLTAGHDAQFSHAATRMRQLVREGYLGGPRYIWKARGVMLYPVTVMRGPYWATANIGCVRCPVNYCKTSLATALPESRNFLEAMRHRRWFAGL